MLKRHDAVVDTVIVGAGPAGLGMARTLSRLGFQTVVVERASQAGGLNGASNAFIIPVAQSGAEPASGGIHFAPIDLFVPESLVLSRRALQRCLAPNGEILASLFDQLGDPAALIDKSGLMRMLVRQAEAAGAEFRWDTTATSLIYDGDRVTGVHTSAGDVRAAITISAEGAARSLCEQANLYHDQARSGRQTLVMCQHLGAPMVGPEQLGRIITLGRAYTSAQNGFGMLVMPAPGHATMYFTVLLDEINCGSVADTWHHLAEYAQDPRIAGYLKGACVLRRTAMALPIGAAPDNTVRDGFMGIGDAITPAGRLGVLPALFLGRQAALVAAGTLEDGDVSAAALAPFDEFYRAVLLPSLTVEANVLIALLQMQDDELNRLCRALNAVHLPVPFLQSYLHVAPEALPWLSQHVALSPEDSQLVSQLFAQPEHATAVYQWPITSLELSAID